MPRYAAKVDDNQADIVKALRGIGASVRSTHTIGKGFPDIAVGYRGKNYLLEIKDGNKPPSARKLTPDEQEFFDGWKGDVQIVNNEDEALEAIGCK